MNKIIAALVAGFFVLAALHAQTVEISPVELSRVPVSGLAGDRYWQQLVITLAAADSAAVEAISIVMPTGLAVADSDADGAIDDEIRIVYEAVADEEPGFFVNALSNAERIVLSSVQVAAVGGRIYVQFPIVSTAVPTSINASYGRIEFADAAESDLVEGPQITFVTQDDLAALSSMQVVAFAPLLAAGADTMAATLGQSFPDVDEVLVSVLPDLVFDAGVSTSSNALGRSDGDDSNDVEYRFFLSTTPNLVQVDESTAIEAQSAEGDVYIEREGTGRRLRLDTSQLPPATYYLYVVSTLTGTIPIGRSRGIAVLHAPEFLSLGPEADITLDSGSLFNANGEVTGNSRQSVDISYALVDLDDEPAVFLFYSTASDLGPEAVFADGATGLGLTGATPLTTAGLSAQQGTFSWHILNPELVPQGEYFVYAASRDGSTAALRRSSGQVRVRHAPFLRLDALNDDAFAGVDTIVTGGLRPQRYISFSWGRSGIDGDADIDSDARIDLYYSEESATDVVGDEGFLVPGGAESMLTALAEERAQLIFGNITEDPDERSDNQYVWDLWALHGTGTSVPIAQTRYYVYGVISDGDSRRLTQMNGGRLNDAAAQLIFVHPPSLRPLQPVAPIIMGPGQSGRVAWEDMDLDDDARIRVLLSSADHGETATYAEVATATSFVVNSLDGRADSGVDEEMDLSEDSSTDHLDFRIDHLTRGIGSDDALQDGEYFVYLAITDADDFASALCWRAPASVQVQGVGETAAPAPPISLLPERFSMVSGGAVQVFEVRVNVDAGVDLVQATFSVDGNGFTVLDQDADVEGVQPFVVGSGFSAAKLVTNRVAGGEDTPLLLTLEYFEPTAAEIVGLSSERTLASFELLSLDQQGPTTIALLKEDETGILSRLERDGVAVVELETMLLSQGVLADGRATLRGLLVLEGRADMTAQAQFTLRSWGDYRPVQDAVFTAANDVDAEVAGVQVEVAADGAFELLQVPAGRFDVHVRVPGYIDGSIAGMTFSPAQVLEGLAPASPGSGEVARLLGGDVAGYIDANGIATADNEVTLADWDYVAAFFGREVSVEDGSARADITADGRVNIQDLSLVGANFRARGPQPVYKIVPGSSAPQVQLSIVRERVLAADEVEWSVLGEGMNGIRAYQLQLQYDQTQWQMLEVRAGGARPTFSVEKEMDYGRLWGEVQLGRERAFPSAGELVRWTLLALRDDAETPHIIAGPFLDLDERRVAVEVAVDRAGAALPRALSLSQNVPNPFNPETLIAFAVPQAGEVKLEIFNALGQRIAVLWHGALTAGHYRMRWSGRDQQGRPAASGMYIYRLQSGSQILAKRMVLVR